MLLSGKVALITGASKGIGRATALRLAEAGATVVAAATREDLLTGLSEELNGRGARVLAIRCDVTRFSECQDLVGSALKTCDRVDILVNNAGVGYSGALATSSPEEAREMVEVNVLGVYHMTRALLPAMISQGGGDIVNLGSVAGVKYSPNFAVYSATKFAVRAFSEALRNEVQASGIRVTLMQPGMTRTPFFESFAQGGPPVPLDQGDILRPEDIAEAIHYAVTRPEGVAVNELTIRPTWQER